MHVDLFNRVHKRTPKSHLAIFWQRLIIPQGQAWPGQASTQGRLAKSRLTVPCQNPALSRPTIRNLPLSATLQAALVLLHAAPPSILSALKLGVRFLAFVSIGHLTTPCHGYFFFFDILCHIRFDLHPVFVGDGADTDHSGFGCSRLQQPHQRHGLACMRYLFFTFIHVLSIDSGCTDRKTTEHHVLDSSQPALDSPLLRHPLLCFETRQLLPCYSCTEAAHHPRERELAAAGTTTGAGFAAVPAAERLRALRASGFPVSQPGYRSRQDACAWWSSGRARGHGGSRAGTGRRTRRGCR